MDKERFLASGLLEQYVLGLTSPEESQEVEKYANAFPEIQEEIDSMRNALEQYATKYAVPPPPGLKSKILHKIDEESTKPQKRQRPSRISSRTLLILTFALAMLAGNLYVQKIRIKEKLEITEAAYMAYQKECEAEKNRQSEVAAIYAFLQHPTTKIIELSGSKLAPDAVAMAYWNENEKKGYVNLLNLPTPPKGQQYQIWADIDHSMVSMGVLDAKNGQIQAIAFGSNATSLNITLEPEGGSKTPNVDLLYVNGPV